MESVNDVNFNIEPKQLSFFTQVDGDKLTIASIELTAEQAAAIAYLVNQPESLKVEISTNV